MFKVIIKIVVFLGLSLGLYAEGGLTQSHLVSVSPDVLETGVTPDTVVEIKFDLPIKEKSVKNHTIVLKQNYKKVKGVIVFVDESTLRFTPNQTLEEGDYTVKVKKVKLQNKNSEDAQNEPKTGFEKFIYWICSLFYDNPADCSLCKKICGNSSNTIKTQKINYSFTVDDSPKIVSILLSETAIELNEGNTTTLSVTVNYDDNTTQDITNEVAWVIEDSSIVSVTNGTVKALKEGLTTVQARHQGKVSEALNVAVYKEINGYRLPPEPEPTVNDATLLGVDSNGNGIRDDVERWVIQKYANSDYPKHKTELGLQWGKVAQQVIQNTETAYEDQKYKLIDRVADCQMYVFSRKLKKSANYRLDNKIFNDDYINKAFNTKKRIKAYYLFNANLAGHTYRGTRINSSKCDFDIASINEQ